MCKISIAQHGIVVIVLATLSYSIAMYSTLVGHSMSSSSAKIVLDAFSTGLLIVCIMEVRRA